jgi:PPP family 3-phenylpropionic acid transporter
VPPLLVLSLFWFSALAALGVFFPLYSLYLSENLGLSGTQTGIVTGALTLSGLVAQPLWGAFADRSGSRVRILAFVCAGTALGYFHLSTRRGFGEVLAATLLLATFSTSVMPMAISVSLALLKERGRHAFGMVRSAGTLGYLVAVSSFPFLLRAVGEWAPVVQPEGGRASQPHLGLMLLAAAAAMAVGAALALALPREGAVSMRAEAGDWRSLRSRGPYLRLVGVTMLTYLFLQGPLVMFPMFVRSLGGDLDVVSRMWVWMLAFEIPLLAGVAAAPSWIGARELIGLGIAADSLRWLVCALSPSLTAISVVQVLHGLAVAGFVVGSALYVEAVVPWRLRSTAQGFLYMVGVSLGGILSSGASGLLLDAFGPRAPALVGGIGGACLAAALPWILPKVPRHAHDDFVAIDAVDERPSV